MQRAHHPISRFHRRPGRRPRAAPAYGPPPLRRALDTVAAARRLQDALEARIYYGGHNWAPATNAGPSTTAPPWTPSVDYIEYRREVAQDLLASLAIPARLILPAKLLCTETVP